ncbi:hypothetical protein [Streptococcus infantarius]|nr:hypothetical protein [Streptococcus infantarius]
MIEIRLDDELLLYQNKIVSLQQENKCLKREIWNLKKTKGKRK